MLLLVLAAKQNEFVEDTPSQVGYECTTSRCWVWVTDWREESHSVTEEGVNGAMQIFEIQTWIVHANSLWK